jgi:flagellar biosynthetic protein FliP
MAVGATLLFLAAAAPRAASAGPAGADADPSGSATPASDRARDTGDAEGAVVPERRHRPTATPPAARPLDPARGRNNGLFGTETSQAMRVALGLTVLAILPGLLIAVTAFLRIVIVLSMLRHAIGMNETPPNTALIGIALFLTLFTMSPVLEQVNREALQPFLSARLTPEAGYQKGMAPLREFMVRQTREQDLALMVELSKAKPPRSMEEVSNVQLIPAFMLSELRAAFQIGFVVFLPFLLIDLVVSSILMALGMMMMPPTTISLPLKILMFVLVDGWSLLLKALVGSFR